MILVCMGGKPCHAYGIDFGECAIDLSLLLDILMRWETCLVVCGLHILLESFHL